MRDPSIHITQSTLMEVIAEIIREEGNLNNIPPKTLARMIMIACKGQSIPNRSVYVGNDKALRIVDKITKTGMSEASLFANLLVMIRQRMHHKGIRVVKPNEKDWLQIKEAAKLAVDFCDEFGVELKRGFEIYISRTLKKMNGSYSLNKFKTYHSAVCKMYEAEQEIGFDPEPDLIEECYLAYTKEINEKVGIPTNGYRDNPEVYVHFKRAKDIAVGIQMPIKKYIKAQFEEMEWAGIPEPNQLGTDKARDRAVKYCAKHNIKLGKKSIKVDLKDIRDDQDYRRQLKK